MFPTDQTNIILILVWLKNIIRPNTAVSQQCYPAVGQGHRLRLPDNLRGDFGKDEEGGGLLFWIYNSLSINVGEVREG